MTHPAILALVTDAFGGRGGIAQYNRDILEAMAATKVVSSIAVLPRHAQNPVGASPLIIQEKARSGRIAYSLAALLAAARKHVDIVFCGHVYLAPLGAAVARIAHAKLLIQFHGIEAWPRPSRLCRAAVESADLVLCVSRYTRAKVLNWASLVPDRVIVVPNTVDDRFTPGDGMELRAELGLQGKRILLTVGRMDSRERYKGHDRIIAALPGLVAEGHDVAYLVIGEGDDRGRLEGLVHQERLEHRVRFLGPVAPDRLAAAYRMADLLVMPSTGEGFGIAFLEAMACGTPALGLSVGGAVDALADGELGTTTTEEELTLAIGRLLSGPQADPLALSAAVRARFGRENFIAGIRQGLSRISLN